MVSAPVQVVEVNAPLRLRLPDGWTLSDGALLEFAALNSEWSVEADADGGVWMMPPAGTESGGRELDIGAQLFAFATASGLGRAFGASSMFRLPNGWRRAADASWLSDERLAGLDPDDEGIWAVCPDFVVEVRSVSDRPARLHEKMEMWVSQGARLGWLVDPFEGVLWVYRQGQAAEQIERPLSLIVTEVSEEWEIDLSRVWR